MGFVGNFIRSIFSPSIPQVTYKNVPKVTGRDLVSSTEADDPEAPLMGSGKKKNKLGTRSLLVQPESLYHR